jgi:hypothetical protein
MKNEVEKELERYYEVMEFFEAIESQRDIKTIRLNRNDLFFSRKNACLEEIDIFCFKNEMKEFWEADEVIFWDDDGEIKILKQH